VEEVWAGSDVAAAVDWIAVNADRRMEVVIDDLSPAAQMIPGLKARRVRTRRSTARDMAKGCGLFETRMNAGLLTRSSSNSSGLGGLASRRRSRGSTSALPQQPAAARRLVELVDKLHKRAQRRGRAGCGQVDVALKQGSLRQSRESQRRRQLRSTPCRKRRTHPAAI
jgi:hypothetical protein